ncbi:hypothetical protein [Burkholderia dolosa]|uniref:hypothetical protein n=1 Tax=Burkholderia dolosa TaxID=152500 RepID=UPI001BA37DDA|nr:hypothetical protein [Burkholderia dolosa]MBR8061342.1 hypothetical protein [Burkholderia dolosa]
MDERTILPRHAGRCGRTIRYKWQSGELQRLHANSIDNAIFAELTSGAQRALRVDAGRCESAAAGAAGAPVHGSRRRATRMLRRPFAGMPAGIFEWPHSACCEPREREDFAVNADRFDHLRQ